MNTRQVGEWKKCQTYRGVRGVSGDFGVAGIDGVAGNEAGRPEREGARDGESEG